MVIKVGFQKSSAKQATSFAMLMVDQLKSHAPKYQQLVMENFLSHPLVQDFLPPYLENMEVLK
jgi:hypothetical protein